MAGCEKKCIPKMFVPKGKGLKRRDFYLNKKFGKLREIIGKDDTISTFHPTKQFVDLFKMLSTFLGVRIYMASFSDDGSPEVPEGSGKKLTVVYAPLDGIASKVKDHGTYFIMNHNEAHKEIKQTLAKEWVNNYQKKKEELAKLIKKRETNSIIYLKSELEGFIGEIECQEATGVRIYFASYTDTEPGTRLTKFEKQLIVQFNLTKLKDGLEQDLFIEEQPGFSRRLELDCPDNKTRRGSFDTGSPCPPENCDGQLLLP